jgi:hypothetical protein
MTPYYIGWLRVLSIMKERGRELRVRVGRRRDVMGGGGATS